MRKQFYWLFVVAIIFGGLGYQVKRVQAQAPGPSLVYANGPSSGCPALPVPNSGAVLCVGSDHVLFAPAAAGKYLQLDSQAVSGGVTQVNGAAPGATGNVTVSCSGTTPATAANFSSGSIPAMAVATTCTGKGN